MTFYTDTGGGGMFIEPATVKRLGLSVRKRMADNTEYEVVTFPQFRPNAYIPAGKKSNDLFLIAGRDESRDGFLGQSWFADRVWKFDYIERQLAFHEAGNLSQPLDNHCCLLGFLTNDQGEKQNSFARIQATIDGDRLDFLFDTGATVSLTETSTNRYLNGGESEQKLRGASFIANSIFETWTARHPDWLVIDHADAYMNESIIEVPVVRIAGYDVGPVWFTKRPDHNFHNYMSQWMDKRVDGALGGSLFKYFSITIDYPNSFACFKR